MNLKRERIPPDGVPAVQKGTPYYDNDGEVSQRNNVRDTEYHIIVIHNTM